MLYICKYNIIVANNNINRNRNQEECMARIFKNISELIGRTPLMELENIERKEELQARVLVKLECFNPAGSVKDRVALKMVEDAEKRGGLQQGGVIIEPTSGNTGIGLASVAASKGYRAIFTMPETMSVERRKLLRAYGAEIVLTEGKLGMRGAIAKADELAASMDNAVVLGQFNNPANPMAHEESTGVEIWEDLEGEIDILVAGVGTGGTITGTAGYLKQKKPSMIAIAVEPTKSPILSGGQPGGHGIMGIGAGFVPEILNTNIYDAVEKVSEEQSYESARMLAREEGILVGISSGAALYAAMQAARKGENRGKTIVAILPDTGERYLSTALFGE